MTFKSGETFDNLYKIQGTFGGGGMGLVHRARHLAWGIDVAIKHPRPEFLKSQNQVDEFHSECATWASLGMDPHITTCFYSRQIGEFPCVVAELLPGGSLQDAISCREIYQGDEEECLSRLLTIAASSSWGLMRAHQARLLHCDIKPGNMLLTGHGIAKIADFGLAVALRPSTPALKAAGLTVAFASPEQIRGNPLTRAADAWSWAASMLAMFMGGASWDHGAACGAALRQFLEGGGKAYRIPAMPRNFAQLLGACFTFSPDHRLADFAEIASRVCEIHEDALGEPCPALKQDLDLVSADSLNNRAMSRLDLGERAEAVRLLDEALRVDPLHPEANFNRALLDCRPGYQPSQSILDALDQDAQLEPGEYRPLLYRACLMRLGGATQEAANCLNLARRIASPAECHEIERQWTLSGRGECAPVLAPPISGEDLAYDSARFGRLIAKAELAIQERRLEDSRRYLLMSGDIPGFARHPSRRILMKRVAP